MPAVALALWLMALLARVTRERDARASSRTTSALRAPGAGGERDRRAPRPQERVLPIVTVLGLQFGGLLGGAVMTETVFAWPGVGTMILDAILKKDSRWCWPA